MESWTGVYQSKEVLRFEDSRKIVNRQRLTLPERRDEEETRTINEILRQSIDLEMKESL